MRFTMSVKFDLMKLPTAIQNRLVKTVKKFRKMYPNIELVVSDKAPGIMRALEYRDFNIILFMGEEPWETANRRRFTQPQQYFHEYGFRIEVVNSYDPGDDYKRVKRIPAKSEAKIVNFNHYRVNPHQREDYLKFLYHNLFCYKGRGNGDLSSVTAINVPAMKSDNRMFCQLYTTNLLERTYMVYHKELQPVPFIDFDVDKPDSEPVETK